MNLIGILLCNLCAPLNPNKVHLAPIPQPTSTSDQMIYKVVQSRSDNGINAVSSNPGLFVCIFELFYCLGMIGYSIVSMRPYFLCSSKTVELTSKEFTAFNAFSEIYVFPMISKIDYL